MQYWGMNLKQQAMRKRKCQFALEQRQMELNLNHLLRSLLENMSVQH